MARARWRSLVVVFAAATIVLGAAKPVHAEDSEAELAKKLNNPIANLISVPFQNNWDWGIGREQAMKFTLNVQPVIPIELGDSGYNVIVRTIVPVIYQQAPYSFLNDASGLGDILQSFFLSPADTVAGWIVGGGPAVLYPSATDNDVGGQKWGMGPTAVVLQQREGWTYGVLSNHIWSFAGSSHRADISNTFIQPFLSYTTKTYTTFGVNTESTYAWNDSQWTVPVNAFVTQLLKIKGQPISFSVGPRYYADTADRGPDWGLRFVVTLLFPKH